MNRDEAVEYARQWADTWNAGDVEAVLAHFDDDVIFTSPKALEAVGASTVRGKVALREYWLAALKPVKSLQFTVVRVIWDSDTLELAIVYDRVVNDRHDRAVELLHFAASSRVARGEAFYGVLP